MCGGVPLGMREVMQVKDGGTLVQAAAVEAERSQILHVR